MALSLVRQLMYQDSAKIQAIAGLSRREVASQAMSKIGFLINKASLTGTLIIRTAGSQACLAIRVFPAS